MSKSKNPFEYFGISKDYLISRSNRSEKEDELLRSLIKTSYQNMLRTFHPDKGGSPEKFMEAKEMYEKLMDDLGSWHKLKNDHAKYTNNEKLLKELQELKKNHDLRKSDNIQTITSLIIGDFKQTYKSISIDDFSAEIEMIGNIFYDASNECRLELKLSEDGMRKVYDKRMIKEPDKFFENRFIFGTLPVFDEQNTREKILKKIGLIRYETVYGRDAKQREAYVESKQISEENLSLLFSIIKPEINYNSFLVSMDLSSGMDFFIEGTVVGKDDEWDSIVFVPILNKYKVLTKKIINLVIDNPDISDCPLTYLKKYKIDRHNIYEFIFECLDKKGFLDKDGANLDIIKQSLLDHPKRGGTSLEAINLCIVAYSNFLRNINSSDYFFNSERVAIRKDCLNIYRSI